MLSVAGHRARTLSAISLLFAGMACEQTWPDERELFIDSRTAVLAPGDTLTMGLTLRRDGQNYRTVPQNPSPWPSSEPITWTSTDPSIATVTTGGWILAIKPGRVQLTARTAGKEVSTIVEVRSGALAHPLLYRKLAAGSASTCGLATDDHVYCWGSDWAGALGHGSALPFTGSYAPQPIASPEYFRDLAVAGDHACAVTLDGRLICWGSNTFGERGVGGTESDGMPAEVKSPLHFTSIAAGILLTCALTDAGDAYCWGKRGQVMNTTPTQVGGPAFASISVGNTHACGLTADGTAYCWGTTSDLVGSGGPATTTVPTEAPGSLKFSAISTGFYYTCGLTTDGVAYCWGQTGFGRLGLGYEANVTTPTKVDTDVTFASISAGEFHTCALTANGRGYCWGSNFLGGIGNPDVSVAGGNATQMTSIRPVLVSAPALFTLIIAAAGGYHTCAITDEGRAWCWGSNVQGELGIGRRTQLLPSGWQPVLTPVAVADPVR